jgi:hypothetical protein
MPCVPIPDRSRSTDAAADREVGNAECRHLAVEALPGFIQQQSALHLLTDREQEHRQLDAVLRLS